MAHLEGLSPIRDLFHKFISRVTGLQAISYFFAYRLKEISLDDKIIDEIKKEITVNINKIEDHYKLSKELLKEIEVKLTEIGISKECAPFINNINKEINDIYKQLAATKTIYNTTKGPSIKENIIRIADEFQKFDPHCLRVADIYKEMKESSVLEK